MNYLNELIKNKIEKIIKLILLQFFKEDNTSLNIRNGGIFFKRGSMINIIKNSTNQL